MKQVSEICARYDMNDYECNDCGWYGRWQPCHEKIPDHIPNIQIKEFISRRRINV